MKAGETTVKNYEVNLYPRALRAATARWYRLAVLTLAFTTVVNFLMAQESQPPARANTMKVDITSHLLYRKAFVLSYERVTKPQQSFCFTAGYQQFPKITSLGQGIRTVGDVKQTGFKAGAEYRFYLATENKHPAPHGVYLGPFASYLYFSNDRNVEITSADGSQTRNALQSSVISVVNIGFQLGYQFVINNRWTIDLVFVGPSVTHYDVSLNLEGVTASEEWEYNNRILKRLIDRFPLLSDLIQDKSVEHDGTSDSWSFGYRYQLLIGYHFGRKKMP
ncbi:DUF3575 domain-containing protein [Fulvivirgaceae bacterium PWU4]|uniref:DUF3575 domain-containing protein n=1 Tax=Chryseosolibacter histidini TaxID=2782349 RepID=A0AAP2GL57_9BACT|nr:DUF3575 domain-containing protein [Chryseosolibacter histidini]MBT1699774.1 DUF3575 domain-containing protein [Chryseosolibacter histidini]